MRANFPRTNVVLKSSDEPISFPYMDPRMTTEMVQAIRRQENTSTGLDYWHSGFAVPPSPQNGNQDGRRTTYNKLTQINLDFPGHCFTTNSTPQQRQKRKEYSQQPIVLSRSKTSLGPSSVHQTKITNSANPTTKKVLLTDLTCLQLADTLFTSKKSPFNGMLNFSQARKKYMDYFGNDRDSNGAETPPLMSTLVSTKAAAAASGTDCSQGSTKDISIATLDSSPLDQRGETPASSETNIPIRRESKPQKSILKNRNQRQTCNNSSEPHEQPRERVCSTAYRLPAKMGTYSRAKSKLTLESIHPTLHYNHGRSAGDAQNKRVEYIMRDAFSGRKRSVRFNAAHEIHEYTPCEPVSYC